MGVTRDLSGKPLADGGCDVVTPRTCSLAIGWFLCFASSKVLIFLSAGHPEGASEINPVGST
jgi:hypothetical protein